MWLRSRSHLTCVLSLATLACISCGAEDTYTQAEAERRTPAETMPTERNAERNALGNSRSSQAESGRPSAASKPDAMERAVSNELEHDPLASLGNVDVQAKDGVVTLTGSVGTLMEKERATHLAETVLGVIAVRNHLVVVPKVEMSADDLESTIRHALVTNPATEAFQIQIEAEPDGDVLLTGEVDSWAERELAGRVAKGVKGVTRLRNQIEIDYQGNRIGTELEAEVARLLRWDAYIDDRQIEVDAERGVVKLTGTVPSAAEKRRAIAMASTAGSQSVDASELKVDPTARSAQKKRAPLSAPEIKQAFITLAAMDPLTDADRVDVAVSEGTVTLRGEVESLQAKRALVRHAQSISGVDKVEDRLTVRSESGSKDAQIERQVIAALAADPLTEAYQISVDSIDGVVTLSGHVDSWFERGTADDLAASVPGVRQVDNDLLVKRSSERVVYDPYVDAWSIWQYDWYTPEPPTQWKQDAEIAREIDEELAWSPFVDAREVSVSVHKGVATLKGTVDSAAERRAATENAFEGGAVGVVNQLAIETS